MTLKKYILLEFFTKESPMDR